MNKSSDSRLFSPAWKRLVWKEVRMVAPFIFGLVLIGLCLHLIAFLSQGGDLRFGNWHPNLLVVIPGLFAAGAGAVLVGQERELRTLSWFSSLPISRESIILAKYQVAIAGLALSWIASLIMTMFFAPLRQMICWTSLFGPSTVFCF